MAVDLIQSTATPVVYVPRDLPARPVSATLSLRDGGDTEKEAPSVTLASVTANIDTVTSQVEFVVSSASGITAGAWLWLTASDGWGGPIRVSEVDGTTVYLDTPPPGVVEVGDDLAGLALSATISASVLTERARNWRLDWTITDAAGAVHKRRQMAHVIATAWTRPINATEASRYIDGQWPGLGDSRGHGWFRRLAEAASDRVMGKVEAAGDYVDRVGDPDVFERAGLAALRVELANEGVLPVGVDAQSYTEAQESALSREVREALARTWVDHNDDDAVGPGERHGIFTVRAVRA